MLNQFSRTELMLGKEAVERLQHATVAIFGVGGVGSFTVEALARSGVGKFVLVDADTVCASNINRQLIATTKTVGMNKVDVMKQRILDINPTAEVEEKICFYGAETAEEFDFSKYDYIVDAIDTVTSKILLITRAKAVDTPIISCMGAGNKLDPTRFEIADITKTSVCPLARVMRKELKDRGIYSVKVLFSKEPAIKPREEEVVSQTTQEQSSMKPKKQTPGSVSFVPSVAGLIIGGEVIKDLIGLER